MKKQITKWSIALLFFFQGILGNIAFGQSAGFNNTFAIMSINGGTNAYYDLNATTALPDFNGNNLGTFNPALNSLTLKGAEHNVYKCGSSDLTSTRLMYRIYLSSGVGGSFNSLNVPFTSTGGNGCGGQDQQWSLTGHNLNVLAGLAPGNYTLEVYSEATVTNCCGGTVYASNTSNNYKATFTVTGTNYVTTNNGSGLASSYATLAAAITALNAATITSPVVITLHGNETAPAGGYNITKSGTSTNTITIQGTSTSTTTVTASTGHTAGALNDAIFKITGADWITIRNFTMQESANTTTAAATNNMTEFGVALFYATTTDGAQNCTIQNNTITLNRTYQNTFGIYSNSTHAAGSITVSATASSPAGSNSGLKVYGNTISNINHGILIIGATGAANFNTGIDIGGTASGTGNTISNFGTTVTGQSGFLNVSNTINGIVVRNSTGFNVSYNSITSSNGGITAATTLRGIFIPAASIAPTGTFTNNINNNTIALTHGFTSGTIQGITVEGTTGTATSTQNINNNNFTSLRSSAAATSGAITAISNVMANLVNNFNGNTFTNISTNTTGLFTFFGHGYTMPAGGSQTINGNSIVTAFSKTGAGGTVTISTSGSSSPNGTFHTFTNNNFSNITVTGATGITGVTNSDGSGSSATRTVTGNTFNNWTGGTSAIIGLSYGYIGGTTSSVSNNTLTNITGQGAISGIVIGSFASLATTLNVANNTINNLSSTGTGGQVLGISCANSSPTININSNAINTLSTTGASSAVGGVLVTAAATTNIFSNTIFGITSSSAGSPLVLGISVQGGTTVNTYQNKIYGLSASGAISTASPAVVGINVTAGTNVNTHNNLIGSLTAPAASLTDAIRGINIASTTATSNRRVYYNTINLNATSSGANFGSTGLFHTYNATGTTSALDMRNNIIVNSSVANGTGLSVAFRRSAATDLANYATTSNNNLFFGTSGVYNDGAATYAFGPFQTLVSTRETASRNQNPTFASTTGADATFLHFVTDAVNLAGANGQVIAGYTTDFDGDTRNASTPDIGADEWVNGFIALPTVTSFSPSTLCLAGGQTVTITGTNLSAVTSVLFNSASGVDLPGVITASTATTLTVTTPANAVAGIIRVVNPAGSADSPAPFTTASAPTIGVSSATSICSGSSTTLTATGGDSYAWSPATGLSSTTGSSVTASPTSTRTYTVTGTSAAGCTATNTVAITVNPAPTAITLAKVPTVACLGGTTTLTATGGQIGLPGTATIGTATTATSAAATEPTAFNNRYKHYWMQMVFTPAELNAAGVTAGNITAVRFTTSTLGDAATVTDLKVRMGTSGSATLTGFQPSGLTLVKTSATYTHAVGVNVLTFDTPYAWDGVSNLLFDLRSTGADATNNAITLYTATTGNTVVSAVTSTTSSSDGFAALSPAATASTFRLNTTFDATVSSNGPISWSPTTDLFTDAAATIAYTGTDVRTVYSKSTTAQTYTASATLGSCTTTSAGITVTPNPLPTISVNSAALCSVGTTSATLTASGGTTYTWSPNTGLSAATGTTVTANPSTTTTYTVTGTDANGCQNTGTSIVTVNTAVSIITEPSNAVVTEGSNAIYSISAAGSDLVYQWQVNTGSGFANISNANNFSYTASGVTSGMNGYQYRCIVSGASPCGSVTSSNATLSISTTAIDAQPVSATICSSGSNTFTISVSGTTPTYQWQVSTDAGVNYTDISGQTTSSLTVSGLTATNSGNRYRCVLSGSINSDAAVLTVYDAVAIGTQPSNQSICAGAASVTFTSAATGSGLSYQWQVSTNGTDWNNASGATSAQYTITSPSSSLNNNQYRVLVSGISPCGSVTSSVATLTVTDVTVAATVASICIGGSTTLNATFTGAPDYSTTSWTSTTGSGAVTAVSGVSATITPTAAGNYTYSFASNGTCSFNKTVAVTVSSTVPSSISITQTPNPGCEGAVTTLTATGGTIPNNASNYGFSTGTTTYSAITGTTLGASAIGDDVGIGNLPIGFTFPYNGTTHTVFAASSNGYLWLGQTGATITGGSANALVSSSNIIAPLWDDNNTSGGSIIYSTAGSSPNRILTVQWTGMHVAGNGSSTTPTINMQVLLYENGDIKFIYGAQSAVLSSPTASIGISGAIGNYLSLTPASPLSSSTSSAASENTAVNTAFIPSGTIFNFIMPATTSGIIWSPTTNLYTNSNGTGAYSGSAASTIYAVNSSATTYTATSTSGVCSTINSVTTVVNPQTTSPTSNTTLSQCGSVATFGITTSVASPTIRWYDAASGGSAIAGQSSTTLLVTGLSAGTYSRWATVANATGCESARVECTVNLVSADPLFASVLPTGNICLGVSVNLSASQPASSNNYALTWTASPALNSGIPTSAAGSLSSALTVTPTGVGTYTYQINGLESSSGCAVSASVAVTVVATATTGVATAVTPTSATVAGSIIANCGIIPTYGIEYSTTSGFANGTGTQVASSNQASGSYTSSLTGLTNNTTYYYKAYATYGSTTVYGTQSSFQTPQICNIALQETFPITTTPTGWTTSSFLIGSGVTGVPAAFTSNYMYVNLDGFPQTGSFTTCNYGPVGANASLTFNYSVTNWGVSTAPASGWGDIQVQISTDFGVTYTTINTITTSSASVTPVSISLSSYAGQYAKFRFVATRTTGDYNVVIDDINAIAPCSVPTNQPTNLTFTNVGPGQMTVNYTASTGAPTGYVVVRYPAGETPTSPVNGTTYTAGIALGAGTVAYVGSNLSPIISGLTVNTTYDFYVYAYNGVTCTNGPVYNTTSPLTGSQSTSGCPTLASVITIGPGADYATLTEAIVILNGCGIIQPTFLELQSNYVSTTETFPIILGTIPGASAANTITVRPAAGVSSALTITSANTTGTINHNAGNYFIFDGRPGSTGTSKFLTIENTANTGYAVNYQNEASNNTLRYLTIKGQNTSTTSGTIVFASTTGANGNDNNTVEYNDICAVNATTASPTNGIYALGSTSTSAANNNAVTISNNNIFDFFSPSPGVDCRGLLVSNGNDGWTISGNSFYQTIARSYTNQLFQFMNVGFTTHIQPFTISNNYFGGTQPQCGGSALALTSTSARLAMVVLSTAMTVTSEFNGNTFANLTFNTANTNLLNNCLQVNNGSWNIGSTSGNIFGSTSQAGSLTITTTGSSGAFSAILPGNGTNMGIMNIRNNFISGITIGGSGAMGFYGMRLLSPTNAGTYTIDNNTIGVSSLVNSISNSTNLGVYGIYSLVNTTAVTQIINANIISNLNATNVGSSSQVLGIWTPGTTGGKYQITNNLVNSLNSSGAGAVVAGIYNNAATTNDQLISGNTIHSLVNTGSAVTSVAGIYYSGPTTGVNEIKSNLIHSLSASAAGSNLIGIQLADAGNAFVFNNMIRLGINSAGSDVTTNALLYGIVQSNAVSNHSIYFNSIYIGGSGVLTGTNNSFALFSAATSGTRDIRNNIFDNVRTNGAGTGKHYAIRLAGLTGLTINNNDYWTGSSFLTLLDASDVTTLSAWQTATSQDAGSLSNDPNFMNPAGSSAVVDLHINSTAASVLESGGVNISGITTDRDGDTRPGPTGSSNGGGISSDIGADEFDATPAYSCSLFPALSAATTNATVCGGTPAILSITGTITGTGITYQWKSASTSGGTYTNIVGATGSTYNVPMASVSNLWYVCDVTCANGPVTATTSAVNVEVLACNYTTSLNTGITYNSIMSSGTTYTSLTSSDDGYTNAVSLTGTTFKYRGSAISGFVATSNGWMTFNTASTSNEWVNNLTSSSYTNVLAPFWEDLVIRGNLIANKDVSMRYQVIGTLGSGTADIIIEWSEMERFGYIDPNINFQVVLHEADNSIDFNYGNFQMFNGSSNFATGWTYSIGMNGPTPATNSTDQRIILQAENKNFFGSASQNGLAYSIECNSQYRFVPSASFFTGSTPTAGSYTNSTFVPANNAVAGAIALPVNGSPCTSNCGNIYSSKNATASSGITPCSATTFGNPDDDVFFTFTTSAITNYRIAVDPSGGYDVVVQVLDASLTPVTCVNAAGAGLSELITSLTLNASSVYYLRIYDAASNATNNGEFAVCISEVIAPPVNDEPAGAIALSTGTACTTTSSILPFTLSATASAGVTSCSATTPGVADDDIWYSFTTNTIAGTTYAITATGVGTYNAVLQLYSGTVGNLVSVNCVNATGNGGAETINAGVLNTNTTYYLRVYHSGSGAATGNVAICVVHTLPTCLTSTTVATSDYIWQGQTTAWDVASNWLIYNEPSSYTVATVAPSNVNVVIPSATCFSNQPVVVAVPSSVNDLTVLSGASLSLGSYTLAVAGNLSMAGTFDAGTGTVNFVGTGTQTVSMGSQAFNNVTMNCTGTVTLSANTTINANYTNTTGSLDMNNFNLAIGGNYTNDNSSASSLIPGTGIVTFNGTGAQAIGGSSSTTFTNLEVNKTSGLLTLNTPANVSGTLTMTAGNIATRIITSVGPPVVSTTNLLTVGTSASAPGTIAWTSGSVLGPIKRWFAAGITNTNDASTIFPVGLSTKNRWAKLNFTSGLATGGSVIAEYKEGLTPVGDVVVNGTTTYLSYAGLPQDVNGQRITNYENEGYWEITPVNGEEGALSVTEYSLKLRGNSLSTVTSVPAMAQLRMIKSHNLTSWDNVGIGDNSGATGSPADFIITNTGMTGFSWFNIGSGTISWLPVELVNFAANCNENSQVDLKWSTASEQNSEKFIIERSRDLAQWEFVSSINAAGNSNYNIEYSTLDTDPFGGISYYRMVQVDNNGDEKIYGPISVACSENENSMIVFPNPTKGNFTVEISSSENISNAQIQITDLTGKVINERTTNILEGKSQFTFEGLDLQLGTYIINLNTGNGKINPVRVVVN